MDKNQMGSWEYGGFMLGWFHCRAILVPSPRRFQWKNTQMGNERSCLVIAGFHASVDDLMLTPEKPLSADGFVFASFSGVGKVSIQTHAGNSEEPT